MLSQGIVSGLDNKIRAYREQQFTGVIKVSAQDGAQSSTQNSVQTPQWFLYSLLGRIVWVQSRRHSLRRWKRHLSIYTPTLYKQITQRSDLPVEAWNYMSLARLVKLKKLSENKLSNVIEGTVAEDLFDILQVGQWQYDRSRQPLSYEPSAQALTSFPFVMINYERAWREAKEQWHAWSRAGLAAYSPDCGLAIGNYEMLRRRTSNQTLQTIKACAHQRSTLRDLAIKFRQPVVLLTKSMLPYIVEDMITFAEVPSLFERFSHGFPPALVAIETDSGMQDTPAQHTAKQNKTALHPPKAVATLSARVTPLPLWERQIKASQIKVNQTESGNALRAQPQAKAASTLQSVREEKSRKEKIKSNAPTIVYIDDSPLDSRVMSGLVRGLGCRYTSIADPIQALPMLLEIKPELIFLDLVMPVANGYEVCSQIRRISAFKETPVIIVTSNDGVADRVRARLVGASGFLGKPIRAKKVAKVLKKHVSGFEFDSLAEKRERRSVAPANVQSAIPKKRGALLSK
ncbi:MAG: response regulator [Cyanobacteria bacterium J06581_3]